MPVDQALITEPGVVHRERDIFSQDGATAERRGFVRDQLDANSIGKLNGNRSSYDHPPARPLTGAGPFSNLRGGSRS